MRIPDRRRGMTLVEMLVAMVSTLILMAAVAQVFAAFGGAITDSRAVLELDARMRSAAWRLRSDLAGITVRPLPPIAHESGEGYLEIIEGAVRDSDAAQGLVVGGDHDDAILFTTRNSDEPFLGRFTYTMSGVTGQGTQSRMIESPLAEVGWFARATPGTSNPTTYTLYRKQLLVMGYLGFGPFGQGAGGYSYTTSGSHESLSWPSVSSSWAGYFNYPFDVSVRLQGAFLYPNSLLDLSRRETRFAHNPTGSYGDNAVQLRFAGGNHQAQPAPDGLIFDSGSFREGEDVVLANVIAFDVRVFDPAAPVVVSADGQTALVPGDPFVTGTLRGSGAYVDLGHGVDTNTILSDRNIAPRFQAPGAGTLAGQTVYDTWSTHYEANGRDEDADGTVDEFNDGRDNNSDGAIDDSGERETSPPYPVPLRGVEIRIRCYEPSSRQVRQVTVRHTFVPH
jgi:hypothetical protein